MRVRIARDELRRLRELTQAINALEAEIAELVAQVAPQLLTEPGFGPLTAAKLVGEIAGADRFATDAKLARAAGLAPIPVSSGRTDRHRLDRGGNRQINAAIHRVAVTRARCHPETRDYIARKKPKARPTAKPSAASNATSPAASGTCCAAPPRPRNTAITHQLLDIGAAEARACLPRWRRPLRPDLGDTRGDTTVSARWASTRLRAKFHGETRGTIPRVHGWGESATLQALSHAGGGTRTPDTRDL